MECTGVIEFVMMTYLILFPNMYAYKLTVCSVVSKCYLQPHDKCIEWAIVSYHLV